MNRQRTARTLVYSISVAVALVAMVALVASGVLGARGASPSQPPPTGSPSAPPTARPSLPPVDDASDGIDLVDLANADRVRYSAVVWDESESLADASSGIPGAGASVDPNTVRVVPVDNDTIQLVWTDLPIENRVRVSVRLEEDGTFAIRLVRPTPLAPTDGEGADRVLILDFDIAVATHEVQADLVDDLLPSGSLGYGEASLGPTRLAIWDETGSLAEVIGQASRPNASVRRDELAVSNVGDASVLRLVWTDTPAETQSRLSIRMGEDGRYKLRLVRTAPNGPTDPIAWDREVVLQFHVSVPANDVDVELIDPPSNAG